MILVLYLEKLHAGTYQATVRGGGMDVTASTVHASLSEALLEVARSVPPEFAQFIEPRYAGCTTGTVSLDEVLDGHEQIAAALVQLAAMTRQ